MFRVLVKSASTSQSLLTIKRISRVAMSSSSSSSSSSSAVAPGASTPTNNTGEVPSSSPPTLKPTPTNAKRKRAPPKLLDPKTVKPNVIPEGYGVITEGSAKLLHEAGDGKKKSVFYNEVQVKNRDLSVLVLNEYCKQLEIECYQQRENRTNSKNWRKKQPTFQNWGGEVTGEPYKCDELKGVQILEALSASGLRSVRYVKEVVDGLKVENVIVNELEDVAINNMKANAAFNGLADDPRFVPNQEDAAMVMFRHRLVPNPHDHTHIKTYLPRAGRGWDASKDTFDVIDLDPYGSPAIFLDSAVQAVRDGGLLQITATDLAAMCGKSKESCYSRYRSVPNKVGDSPHEFAIRMLLCQIESQASVYGRYIVPLLSVKMDFYIRVFVRVYSCGNEIKKSATKKGMVFQSRQCSNFWIQPLCVVKDEDRETNFLCYPSALAAPTEDPESGASLSMCGPIWTDPIHNAEFVKALLKRLETAGPGTEHLDSRDIIHGQLLAVSQELVDAPLFYSIPKMSKTLHVSSPPAVKVFSALEHAGYKYSKSHYEPGAVKTDAPNHVMWDIFRAWAKTNPPLDKGKKDPVSQRILGIPSTTEVNFKPTQKARALTNHRKGFSLDKGKKHQKRKPALFPQNPKPNWGPKARATGTNNQQTHRSGGDGTKRRKYRDRDVDAFLKGTT